MPACDSNDPIVTLTGHVRRSIRDRFAAYARSVGHTPAALIRMIAEDAVGETSAPPSGGSAQKVTLRLRDDVRRRLRDVAAENRTTPTAWATMMLEAQLCGRVCWTPAQTTELRAVRVLLADLRDRAVDATVADRVAKAMRLVDAAMAGQVAHYGATAISASPAALHPAPGVRSMAGADASRPRPKIGVSTLRD